MQTSASKVLEVLLVFDEGRMLLGVSEIARILDMPPSSVQRYVNILKDMGFLVQDAKTKKYRLGTVFLRLATVVKESLEVARVAYPVMQKLSRITGETVHLNVIDGYERVCVESIESSQPLMARMPVGHRSPLYSGASSKCLLAFSSDSFIGEFLKNVRLDPITEYTITDPEKFMAEIRRIRKKGYAESFSERVIGLGAISAPVFGYGGDLLASLSLAIPEVRFKDRSLRKRYVKLLLDAAQEISSFLGFSNKRAGVRGF